MMLPVQLARGMYFWWRNRWLQLLVLRLPIKDPVGTMVIDMVGGTTDMTVISLGGIVKSKNLKVVGDNLILTFLLICG